jgi:hypothetical protein
MPKREDLSVKRSNYKAYNNYLKVVKIAENDIKQNLTEVKAN